MGDDFLFTVCCPSCGTVICKSFKGARTFTKCSKCGAELFYETNNSGAIIKITKEPDKLPRVPVIPV